MDLTMDLVPATEFRIFSGLLKASRDGDGRMRLHGVASSTTKDLHGDTMTDSALEDMEKAANNNLTIFLNHSYNVPEDVGGSVEKALIKTRGSDHEGNPNRDLDIDIVVNEENPRAINTWKAIDKGTKLGLSIGAMIPEGGAKRQKNGSYIIEHVDLLETSLVGIPANPRSWVDYAAKALRLKAAATHTDLGNPTLTLDGDRYKIEGSMKGIEMPHKAVADQEPISEIEHYFSYTPDEKVAITRSIDTPNDDGSHTVEQLVLGAWDFKDPEDLLVATAAVGEEIIQKATVWVETRDGDKITIGEPVAESLSADGDPDLTKTACPTCGKGKDATGCSDAYHTAAIDPDVEDAKVRIIEVDTDDQSGGGSSQGADGEPDDGDETYAAPTADVTADALPEDLEGLPESELVKLGFGQLTAIALSTTERLVETRRQLGEVTAQKDAAIRERDEIAEKAGQLVERVAKTLKAVGDITLLPKARKAAAEQSFADVEQFYGAEFAEALKTKKGT